jgi:hypothetical protein
MNETLKEFEKFNQSRGDRKLTNVQNIINFYFWFKKLSVKYEPYARHVSAAKKIDTWSEGNLSKAYELIAFIGGFFESKNLEYTLDTVYRKIPFYEADKAEEDKYKKMDEEETKRSRQIIEEARRDRELLEKRNKKEKSDDFDF